MIFKKYGTGSALAQVFKQKYRVNQRLKENNIKKSFQNLFFSKNRYLLTEKKLFESTNANITFLKTIKSYRGNRHKARLPVRGQRTHTNASKKVFKRRKFI